MSAAHSNVDPAYLAIRTRALIEAGRATAARPLLEALRRCDSEPRAFADLEVRLLLQEGRTVEAESLLDATLESHPSDVTLLLHRSELRIARNELLLGADDAAAAVIAKPDDALAKAMLGVALIRLERFREATTCLAEAVAGEPRHPGFRLALAEGLEASGDSDAAAATLEAALARWPSHLPLHTASIMVAMRSRVFAHALELADAARRAGVADACVFGLRGHALSNLGRHAEAAESYEEALKLAPEDAYVRHLVSASGLLPQATRAPPEYVKAVFDGYAERFETHLIDLGYRVPGLIRAAVAAHWPPGAPLDAVLDLGCGTGFVGVALSDLGVNRIVGVDLSGGMLARARSKGLYAELIQGDIETVLDEMTESWDVVVAADVLIYFGDLGRLIRSSAARLRPGGLFIASMETIEPSAASDRVAVAAAPDDARADFIALANVEPSPATHGGSGGDGVGAWRLHCQGRFAHNVDYIRALAESAGLRVCAITPECLRYEAGAPVYGALVVFARGDRERTH